MLHLDRGYDSGAVRQRLRGYGLDEFDIQRRGTKMPGVKKQPLRLGLRWVVEATNTWWSNYGQLRRNTDRRARGLDRGRVLVTRSPSHGLLHGSDDMNPPSPVTTKVNQTTTRPRM